jgi:hypothetical protein
MRLGACLFAASLTLATAIHANDAGARLGARTRDEFRARLATVPYDPGVRAGQMIAGAQKVTRCMSHVEVRKLMGEPAFGNATHRSGDPTDQDAGAAWTYILSAVRSVTDPYDRMITVWFDKNGRVTSINPRGIDEVLPLRDNKQKCP